MILPTMNKEELAREIFSDCKNVDRKAAYLFDEVARKARRRKLKEYQTIINYKSPKKNDWLIIIQYQKKKQSALQTIVYYRDKNKFQAINVMPERNRLVIHSEHFLYRYNQRFLHSGETNKQKLLYEFVSRNPLIVGKISFDEANNIELIAGLNDGFGLGFREILPSCSIDYMNTFITKEMKHAGQENDAEIISEIFNQINKPDYGTKQNNS